ncbi:hypothetical protein Tco_1291212 [Tanacetum coccineum]
MKLFAAGRKSRALISGGQFVARLPEHFGLLTEERLRGLTVIAPALSVIDMAELVRLQICVEIDDTWAWVASGPERQPDVAAGALKAAKDAPVVDEGGQAVLAPVQAPQQPPPPPPAAAGRHFRHSMGPSRGAHLQHSRDAPGRGLARPAPPQPSRTSSSQSHDPSILCFYLLTKTSSKFSNIVREYVTEPSMLSKPRAEWRRESDFKCMEAEEKV